MLSEPATRSAQWIVDALAQPDASPESCPALSRQDMIVFDDGAESHRAVVAWLGDGTVAWLGVVVRGDHPDSTVIAVDSIDAEAARESSVGVGNGRLVTFFAFLPGAPGRVVLQDDDHRFGPPHQRTVDFGGGREFTIAAYDQVR
ncbi:hypothetical protein ACPC54_28305 [Kitasatospora sp. NPDC094028]